jgi:FkbM family methyltransferase
MSGKERFKRLAARLIQDNRRGWAFRMAASAARFYSNSWEYPSFEIAENGEAGVLRSLGREGIRTVFDVGANVGDWSLEAARMFPTASVHAFEPVPDTFAVLAGSAKRETRVTAHPYGLSEDDGIAEFTYYGAENSFLSTMATAVHDHLPSSRLSIQLRRGDDVMRELSTPIIDLLKIDVEGMEYEVLCGFREALGAGKIGLIQFEKQPGRRLFKDYYGLLGGHGYRIGKIHSRYVDFRPYDSAQERTAGPNYLAVPASRTALIERLRRGLD